MNLEQLKAKYAKGATTVKSEAAGTMEKAWSATKNAAVKTTGAVRGTMPVTTRRFERFASELDGRVSDHDKELFKQGVMIELIAQQAGIQLPTDTQLEAYYQDYLKQQEEEAKKAEAQAEVTEATMLAFLDKVLAKVGFNSKEVIDEVVAKQEEEEEKEETAQERRNRLNRERRAKRKKEREEQEKQQEEQQEEAPKKEEESKPASKRGRRRLGRQAPLVD